MKPISTKCKICNQSSIYIFSKLILNKHKINYFLCPSCDFLQTEKPYWLDQAYDNAITSTDIGLVNRNIVYSNLVEYIINQNFKNSRKFLDFAGGYGMFTRLMRDKGFNFYHHDDFCNNLFAQHFTLNDLPSNKRKFELITAFELMEHLENPYDTLNKIFALTNNFLFSTELIPNTDIDKWWYLGTEHGQHISFYTPKSLQIIATKFNKKVYSYNNYLHIFTNIKNPTFVEIDSPIKKTLKKLLSHFDNNQKLPSLTQPDYTKIKKMISHEI